MCPDTSSRASWRVRWRFCTTEVGDVETAVSWSLPPPDVSVQEQPAKCGRARMRSHEVANSQSEDVEGLDRLEPMFFRWHALLGFVGTALDKLCPEVKDIQRLH